MKLEMQTETLEPLETEEEESYFEAGKKELLERFQMQLQEYEDQRKGVDQKLKKVQSDMYMAIAVFIVVFLVDFYFGWLLKLPGAFILAFTWEMWVAVAALFFALWKTGMHMIKRIAEYNIHHENKLFEGYRKKFEIFTLKEEGRFCDQQKRKVQALIKEVENLETKESLNPYYEIQYVEKRADSQVFEWFETHAVLCYGIMAVLILLYLFL